MNYTNKVNNYLCDEKLCHVSTRVCINDCSFQTDTHNENCQKEAGHHNKETHGVVIFYT